MHKPILLILTFWSAVAHAQVANQPSSSNSNELVVTLYNQIEDLKREVQTLRGLVEEQAYQLKRMDSEATQRYLDLDQRLLALSSGNGAPLPNPNEVGVTPPPANLMRNSGVATSTAIQASAARDLQGATQTPDPSLTAPELSEQDLYRTALNMLLEENNSAEALRLFQTFIERYPSGRLLPNALYWQGEAMILLAQYPQARGVFERVMAEFPQEPKAAAAMLKLGVVFDLMGNRAQAEQTWRDLPVKFPDSSSEITLARDYLSKQQ